MWQLHAKVLLPVWAKPEKIYDSIILIFPTISDHSSSEYFFPIFMKYSRTSIIRPSIIRISGLTKPKSCLPTHVHRLP